MQNYNNIQRFFYKFVFSKKFINKSLFEIEKIIFLKNIKIQDQPHIFISGLPRSGTTSLLNFIYASNQYVSLTYRSMPFVFSPNLSKLFNKKNIPKRERVHNDGIIQDINSPEAFDEVFFNNDEEFIKEELLNYLQLICISENKKKYLSKNNLNFNRIDLISKLLPNCIFLIPVREPLHHSYSLLRQHLNFSHLQKEDNFILRYMNFLGHNEFGLNHKPWHNPVNHQDLSKIDYWLEQWCLFYENILNHYQSYSNCHFIIYEKLNNFNYIKAILEEINFDKIEDLDLNYFKNSNKQEVDINYSKNVYKKACDIYNSFKFKLI